MALELWQRIEAAEFRYLADLELEVDDYLFPRKANRLVGQRLPNSEFVVGGFKGESVNEDWVRRQNCPQYLRDVFRAFQYAGDFRWLRKSRTRYIACVGSSTASGENPAQAIMAARIKNDR